MQLTAAETKVLKRLNCSLEIIAFFADKFDNVQVASAVVSAPPPADKSEVRRIKDKERKRLARLTVRKTSANGADLSADLSAKSPTPPFLDSSSLVVSKGVLKESKGLGFAREEIESFERFKAKYPKRSGNQPWNKALPKYVRIVRSGVRDLVLIDGADRYRGHCDAEGVVKTKFVAQAITWLNGEGWKNEYESNGAGGTAFSQASAALNELITERSFDFGHNGNGGPDDKTPPY